jgi:hypothetical protein
VGCVADPSLTGLLSRTNDEGNEKLRTRRLEEGRQGVALHERDGRTLEAFAPKTTDAVTLKRLPESEGIKDDTPVET